MEFSQDWSNLERLLEKLLPNAREFNHTVKNEVLDAMHEATTRTRDRMTEGVTQVINSLLAELLPASSEGLYRASHKTISEMIWCC